MLEMVREYWEAGYEVIVAFYEYEEVMESWDDILEAFKEVEVDKRMYWSGHAVDEVARRLYLRQELDD